MNNCETLRPGRRATALIEVVDAALSETMAAFSSRDHVTLILWLKQLEDENWKLLDPVS